MRIKQLFIAIIIICFLSPVAAFGQWETDYEDYKKKEETKIKKVPINRDKVRKPVKKSTKNPPRKTSTRKKQQLPPLNGAKISIDEMAYDFGFVPAAGAINHKFRVMNTGPDTLIISKIKAS
ncbi:MAG: DUF1573 domain-containing protein [candidate division Zixibacteria bacterium]|nr:DUF1573 domain-containing protein [candidate division Zixibacteria bacterium]